MDEHLEFLTEHMTDEKFENWVYSLDSNAQVGSECLCPLQKYVEYLTDEYTARFRCSVYPLSKMVDFEKTYFTLKGALAYFPQMVDDNIRFWWMKNGPVGWSSVNADLARNIWFRAKQAAAPKIVENPQIPV